MWYNGTKDVEGKIGKANNWKRLQQSTHKKGIEAFILTAQEQELQTNVVKSKIQNISSDSKCRVQRKRRNS